MKHMLIALAVLGGAVDAQAQATGYPACDKYFTMVGECIGTKMPASEREDAQAQLDQFRVMLANFITGERATKVCEENIRLEMQRDRYGCYAARAAAAGVRTACSLVTPRDLQDVLGVPFAAGVPGNSKCTYDAAGQPARMVVIEANWSDGAQHMKAWRAAASQVRRESSKEVVRGETLSGIAGADDAFQVDMGFMPALAVRAGDVALSVQAAAPQPQLIEIARRALKRIR